MDFCVRLTALALPSPRVRPLKRQRGSSPPPLRAFNGWQLTCHEILLQLMNWLIPFRRIYSFCFILFLSDKQWQCSAPALSLRFLCCPRAGCCKPLCAAAACCGSCRQPLPLYRFRRDAISSTDTGEAAVEEMVISPDRENMSPLTLPPLLWRTHTHTHTHVQTSKTSVCVCV